MPNIFIASVVKSTDGIPQAAISISFKGPNSQISHLETLFLKLGKEGNKATVSTNSCIDSFFSRKNVVSSAQAVYKKR